MKTTLSKAKRIVIKIGTSILTDEDGNLSTKYLSHLVEEIAKLHRQEMHEFIIVTSGAIGAGMQRLRLKERPQTIILKQTAAAVGQNILIEIYEGLFKKYEQTIAQILLTHQDMSCRKSYINILNTISKLLEYKVIPIINENDTVAVDELKFGDNDTLAALVSQLVEADLLLILSNVDGLYSGSCELIPIVYEITPEIIEISAGTRSKFSTGGMQTKIEAAKIATQSGTTVIISNGKKKGIISEVLKGEKCGTTFVANENKLSSRKRWIMYHLKESGELIIDEGAKEAILNKGKSLLPSGILEIKGKFDEGDAVIIKDTQNRRLAKGLIGYSQNDLLKIKGRQTNQIEEILGYAYEDEIIHRDNLVVLESATMNIFSY
ncbi:MAG: glutamate 5-kinase [bacterium]|nr:glutamate 5-kinase [bacterium]